MHTMDSYTVYLLCNLISLQLPITRGEDVVHCFLFYFHSSSQFFTQQLLVSITYRWFPNFWTDKFPRLFPDFSSIFFPFSTIFFSVLFNELKKMLLVSITYRWFPHFWTDKFPRLFPDFSSIFFPFSTIFQCFI